MANTPLTPENFERLLLCLDVDREKAGDEYLLLWQKMREYFAARGSTCAEELADETISRLARKIADGEQIRDILRFSFGLSRLIWMESLRKPENSYISFDDAPTLSVVLPDFLLRKEQNACYLHCIRQITDEEKNLMIEYWEDDQGLHYEARKLLAEKKGISPTALRIRVSRIKRKLEVCMENCRKHGLLKTK